MAEKLEQCFARGDKAPAQVRAEALAKDTSDQYPIAPNKRIAKYKAKFVA